MVFIGLHWLFRFNRRHNFVKYATTNWIAVYFFSVCRESDCWPMLWMSDFLCFIVLFIYLFILPHHKYNQNNNKKNRKNKFNNGEETQRSIKFTEGGFRERFSFSDARKDESCVLKLDTDDNQVSHKTTYCFAFTNSCTLPLSVQVISLPFA